jgi:hypothetical protein
MLVHTASGVSAASIASIAATTGSTATTTTVAVVGADATVTTNRVVHAVLSFTVDYCSASSSVYVCYARSHCHVRASEHLVVISD